MIDVKGYERLFSNPKRGNQALRDKNESLSLDSTPIHARLPYATLAMSIGKPSRGYSRSHMASRSTCDARASCLLGAPMWSAGERIVRSRGEAGTPINPNGLAGQAQSPDAPNARGFYRSPSPDLADRELYSTVGRKR
jgi:hypothetical protein